MTGVAWASAARGAVGASCRCAIPEGPPSRDRHRESTWPRNSAQFLPGTRRATAAPMSNLPATAVPPSGENRPAGNRDGCPSGQTIHVWSLITSPVVALTRRHPHDQLRVDAPRPRRVHRRGERAAKACVASVMPSPISGSRNAWTVHGPRAGGASPTARPSSISSGSAITVPSIDLPPRDSSSSGDRVKAAPVEIAEQVDRELRYPMSRSPAP